MFCDCCGDEIEEGFEIIRGNKVFCSHHCVKKYHFNELKKNVLYDRIKHGTPVKYCEYCNKEMRIEDYKEQVRRGWWERLKYCSFECRQKANAVKTSNVIKKWRKIIREKYL